MAPDAEGTLGGVPGSVQAGLRALSQSRFFARVAERMLVADLRQVRRYLTDPVLRAAARQRVMAAIGPDTAVGHSSGSVVAYEALCALEEHGVRSLVTLGSPLGIPHLIFDRLDPPPQAGVGRWPGDGQVRLVLARPPQVGLVRAGGGDAIGTDDGAVEVEVCEAGRGRALQLRWTGPGRGRRVRSALRGGSGRPSGRRSGCRGRVESAQDQHALFERPQGTGALAGPETLTVFEQQLREGLSSGPADIEHAGVGDTGQRVKPLGTRNLFFADLFLPGASRVSDAGSSPSDVPSQEDLGSVGRAAYSEPCPHYLGES